MNCHITNIMTNLNINKKYIPIIIILCWLIILIASLYLGRYLIPLWDPHFPYSQNQLLKPRYPNWLWPWANFDGTHYILIAKDGYTHQYTEAFFPLFPFTIRFLSQKLAIPSIYAGLSLNFILFIINLYLLKKINQHLHTHTSKNPKSKSPQATYLKLLITYLIFPTSFFFISLYSESLFLFLTLTTFLSAYKNKWWLAGISGALATATRFVGIIMIPSLLIIWWQQHQSSQKTPHQLNIISTLKTYKNIIPIIFVSTGLIAYMYYLYTQYHDPLYFFHIQSSFSTYRQTNSLILLPQVFWRYLKIIITVNWFTPTFTATAIETLTATLFLFLCFLTWKKYGPALGLYTLLSYITPTMTGSFASLPRYVLVLFPAFIALTEYLNTHRRLNLLYQTISPILLITSIIYFTRGWWIA